MCNVVYVDRSVRVDRVVRSQGSGFADVAGAVPAVDQWESPSLRDNVGLLLDVFDQGG